MRSWPVMVCSLAIAAISAAGFWEQCALLARMRSANGAAENAVGIPRAPLFTEEEGRESIDRTRTGRRLIGAES